jgi:hypothetical protein
MRTTRVEGKPVDLLGDLAQQMLGPLESPWGPKARAVVFLEREGMCMTALEGWDSDLDAMVAVFAHMSAVFEANGKKLMLFPVVGHD